MDNRNEPAMPTAVSANYNNDSVTGQRDSVEWNIIGGLTKREYAAIQIMAGLASRTVSNGYTQSSSESEARWAAEHAVALTDALFAALAKAGA